MIRSTQNLANEGFSAKILRTNDLTSKGGTGFFRVLGIASYFFWLITMKHFNSRGWAGLWKSFAIALRGKEIKIFCWGLTGYWEVGVLV
jgi:hypothetical protein